MAIKSDKNVKVRKFILAMLAVSLVFPQAALAAFSTPINISPVGSGLFPSVAADSGGVIHVVYADTVTLFGNREIVYNKSTDGGVTFPTANRRNISNTGTLSTSPKMEIDANGGIHIVWEEFLTGDAEIMYVQSSDSGASFSAVKNISNNSTNSVSPNVETSGANRVFVTWTDEVNNLAQVLFARSSNGGNTFSTPVNISNTAHALDKPQIAARGGTVVVAWQGEGDGLGGGLGIYRVLSSDNGASFNSALILSALSSEVVTNPRMAFDGADRLHVVAERQDANTLRTEIDYYRSTNLGSTFGAVTNISNTPGARSTFPVVRTSGSDTVKVSWNEDVCNPGCQAVTQESESTNGGLGFNTPAATDFTTAAVQDVDFDIFGTTLHIVYQEGNTVKYKKGSR